MTGMGGSSVLAAAVLSAVSALLGSKLDKERLIHLVSQVEQGSDCWLHSFVLKLNDGLILSTHILLLLCLLSFDLISNTFHSPSSLRSSPSR